MSGLIPQRFIEDLLDRVDLAELIGSRITLKKAGPSYKARCPFHEERTPSFNVRPDKGFYHCFGCGAHGDAISFLREFENLGFTDAVEDLARRQGVEVPYDKAVQEEQRAARTLTDALQFAADFYTHALKGADGHIARDYLKQRGLDQSVIERYQLGFAPGHGAALYNAAGPDRTDQLLETRTVQISEYNGQPRDLFRNRIMFPIRNSRGKVVAFGGRTLGDDKAKYINSPESDVFHKSREIYGLYEAKQATRQLDRLLVVEGYMDVIALAQMGIHYAVATLGTATNSDNLSALLRQVRHIIFCFDGDEAGYRAADRALDNALELLGDGLHLQFLMLPQGEDPDTLIRKEGEAAFSERIKNAQPLSRFLFMRQSEGLDLALAEHRSELKHRVEPMIKRMPRSTLSSAMWQEMMRLCGNRKFQPQSNEVYAGKGDRYGNNRYGASEKIAEQRVAVRLSNDLMACLALIEAPEMAQELLEVAERSRNLNQCREFARWIAKSQLRSQSALIRALATDSVARERFGGLFDRIEHLPGREEALACARNLARPQSPEELKRQHIVGLKGRSLDELTAEEREQLKAHYAQGKANQSN